MKISSLLLLPCALLVSGLTGSVVADTGDRTSPLGAKVAASTRATVIEDQCLHDTRVFVYKAIYDDSYTARATAALGDLKDKSQFPLHVKMYYAMLKAVEARDGFWPARRIRLIDEALAEMEIVLAAAPDDYEFRMLRASIWYDLPGSYKKKELAHAELVELADNFETGTAPYKNYLKSQWLDFFLDHSLYSNEVQGRNLERTLNTSDPILN